MNGLVLTSFWATMELDGELMQRLLLQQPSEQLIFHALELDCVPSEVSGMPHLQLIVYLHQQLTHSWIWRERLLVK